MITIDGVDKLMGCFHEIIPDRIEAATYVVLAAAAADEMVVENIIPQHLDALLMKLDEIGIDLEVDVDRVIVKGMKDTLKGTAIKTKPYPGFATDIQQPLTEVVATDLRCGAALVVAGLIADGITEIHDVYHIDRGYENLDGKLSDLGAKIWRETIE